MPCLSAEPCSELDFVRALQDRPEGECKGPSIVQTLWSGRVLLLERIFDSQIACDVLWSGYLVDRSDGLVFDLCAAHWFDLACFAWARSRQQSRRDWAWAAEELLQDLCHEAGWDAKEIVNMFAWQSTRLT
jgi:hypothetical protein